MKIKIDSVVDHGTLNSERVILSVMEATDLKYFIVADTTYLGTSISNKLRHMHWFLPRSVQAGDIVELYTKTGTNRQENIGNGKTKYIIHWELEVPVWNNEGDAALLIYTPAWKTTKARGAD